MTQTPLDFILEHKVFRLEEFLAGRKAATAREALKYHLASSRLARVRRGVYAHNKWVDPWFVASMLAKHAIISHVGAMSFHFPDIVGVDHCLTFMTTERIFKVKARAMISHALRYESPLLCSRLGICLTCADFFPEDDERGRLQKASLKRIAHFRRTKANPKTDRCFPPWNIIVPSELYAFVRAP